MESTWGWVVQIFMAFVAAASAKSWVASHTSPAKSPRRSPSRRSSSRDSSRYEGGELPPLTTPQARPPAPPPTRSHRSLHGGSGTLWSFAKSALHPHIQSHATAIRHPDKSHVCAPGRMCSWSKPDTDRGVPWYARRTRRRWGCRRRLRRRCSRSRRRCRRCSKDPATAATVTAAPAWCPAAAAIRLLTAARPPLRRRDVT